jgi:hypothetical protein
MGAAAVFAAAPGTITIGKVTAAPGASVEVPITLAAGASKAISTLQFDLVLPKGVTVGEVKTGSASSAAGKTVNSAKVPDGLRVIVFGLNQTALASGDVASIQLTVDKGVTGKSIPLTMKGVVVSDDKGNKIPIKSKAGAIQISTPVASAQ